MFRNQLYLYKQKVIKFNLLKNYYYQIIALALEYDIPLLILR